MTGLRGPTAPEPPTPTGIAGSQRAATTVELTTAIATALNMAIGVTLDVGFLILLSVHFVQFLVLSDSTC